MGEQITRDTILRWGQGQKVWDFLSVMGHALQTAPDDHQVRLLGVSNLARLGLGALARQQIELLPPEVQAYPDIQHLYNVTEKISDNRLGPKRRIRYCKMNLDALGERANPLTDAFGTWCERIPQEEAFISSDGNVIRRPCSEPDPAKWKLVGDHRAMAQTMARQLATQATPSSALAIEGVDPPWFLELAARYLQRQSDGSHARLTILQADPLELLDALSTTDLRDVLQHDRIHILVGPNAGVRYAEWLEEHRGVASIGFACTSPSTRTRIDPAVDVIVADAENRYTSTRDRLIQIVEQHTRGRDAAYWLRRYADARAGGDPLRILIPSSRFSTYVKHAARDLSKAFRMAGCETRVFIEPADHSRLTKVGYLDLFSEFDPDLIVLINYPRSMLGEGIPTNTPFVCWIQDAMPHLFDENIGRAQGPLDFVAGHFYAELFDRFGYARDRFLHCPATASRTKFHSGPVEQSLNDKYSCELAVVTNHSETPEAMQRRLQPAILAAGVPPEALDAITTALWKIAREDYELASLGRAQFVCAQVLEDFRPRSVDVAGVARQYAMPLLERMMRHLTLEWAASIADRRNWRLHIYGRGWSEHPTFSRFAMGEIEHGEPLRACYQAAACQLHVSIHGAQHQRVFETALSGGLPLCSRTSACRNPAVMLKSFLQDTEPDSSRNEKVGYVIANHPAVMAAISTLQDIGFAGPRLTEGGILWIARTAFDAARSGTIDSAPPTADVLVDQSSTTFGNELELERLAARAVERPVWRAALSTAIARRVRESLTTEDLATRLLMFVESSLEQRCVTQVDRGNVEGEPPSVHATPISSAPAV
ncbi:MAG: hypothetical protein ACF8GE_11425 [Phycisphaerales bacterium JB043]